MRTIFLVTVLILTTAPTSQPPPGHGAEKPRSVQTWMACHGTMDVVRGKIVGLHPEICTPFDYKTAGAADKAPTI